MDDCVENTRVEKQQSDEKISEHLEQIEKLTSENNVAKTELENQRDVAAQALTEGEFYIDRDGQSNSFSRHCERKNNRVITKRSKLPRGIEEVSRVR